jgi:putative redox protein
MVKINGRINREHFKTIATNSRKELIGDETAGNGGTDQGFSPEELLCSALLTCTCITLRMYADRKNWPLESVEVKVSMEKDADQKVTRMHREIQLKGNLSREQKERLMEIANQCPVHRVLTNPIEINTAYS